VTSGENSFLSFDNKASISEELYKLAVLFPQSKIVWCDEACQQYLNLKEIELFFHHNKIMLSYSADENGLMGKEIGYVEQSPFIKINKKVSYPTWQMSSLAGVIHASLLIEIKHKVKWDAAFDYYLNSVAKVCMPLGLLCYSEPRLLLGKPDVFLTKASKFEIFRFVKQHYKMRWVFLLLLNIMIYERKFPIIAFLFSFFYKNRTKSNLNLGSIKVESSRKVVGIETVDVIIPTIGRKNYLYDVLKDFTKQSLLPHKVIIIEQNPLKGSKTEMNFIEEELWPFEIQHLFIHQTGACNARNLALEKVNSEWVFLADDDIRVGVDFVQKTLGYINDFGARAVTLKCYQKAGDKANDAIFQWGTFGSGCSFVLVDSLKNCKFKMGYEFGFGEDGDFGMQLRNQGHDILYLPEPSILHLKAPIGGFRIKPILQWQNDTIQPKPSPTVMLYQISHNTEEQIRGYKTILFFKYYKVQEVRNPIKYYTHFQKQWKASRYWANKLKNENEI
jgi:glycosyltransferase involved in cell wall biosynthesis